MAHYALINENNIVVNVITGVDEDVIQTDLDGSAIGGSSENWEAFYESLPWFAGFKCKRTSYNGKIRKHYAGIGFSYDPINDVFIPPKPFNSWLLNEETFTWQPPKPCPNDGYYIWIEQLGDWVEAPAL